MLAFIIEADSAKVQPFTVCGRLDSKIDDLVGKDCIVEREVITNDGLYVMISEESAMKTKRAVNQLATDMVNRTLFRQKKPMMQQSILGTVVLLPQVK